MADLISRAAAIKEIKSLRYCGDFVSTLIHLPAVNAIPMEWLEKRWRETLPDGIEPDFDINYALQEVMSEWWHLSGRVGRG